MDVNNKMHLEARGGIKQPPLLPFTPSSLLIGGGGGEEGGGVETLTLPLSLLCFWPPFPGDFFF